MNSLENEMLGRRVTIGHKDIASLRKEDMPIDEGDITDAFGGFLEKMLDISGVDAAAFISVTQQPAPTTLSIEICGRVGITDPESDQIVDKVLKAHASLNEHLLSIIPTGLSFRDTRRAGVDGIEEVVRREYENNQEQKLLFFIVFNRAQTVVDNT